MARLEILDDTGAVARRGATLIAAAAREAILAHDHFTLAVSGGHTPWQMLQALAGEDVAWEKLRVFQVDERIAPAGDPDRNLTHLQESLLSHAPLRPELLYAMPVEMKDLARAAELYQQRLVELVGAPPVLDLIHLGLGPDGHTASLVPGDPVLNVTNRDVAITGVYQGRRRMTLTFPVLNRAHALLWLVTGEDKLEMLPRLLAGDHHIPGGRVHTGAATILADRAAARLVKE